MAGDPKETEIHKQEKLLKDMQLILSDIYDKGVTDELAARVLNSCQDNIRLYQSFLDAQKFALAENTEDSELLRIKQEVLQLRQQKLADQNRNRNLAGELISLRQKEEFRVFVEDFWDGIRENPVLAEHVFGIELGLGMDSTKSQVLTKKMDFVIANFLDIVKANENFNKKLTEYAAAANTAEAAAEKERRKAAGLEQKLAAAEQKLLEITDSFDKISFSYYDSVAREEVLAQQAIDLQYQLEEAQKNISEKDASLDSAKSQFENIRQDLESELSSINADLASVRAINNKYQIVYDSVLELLPDEARADLPNLLKSDDADLRELVQGLFKEALVKASELDNATQRYARAEKVLEAIFKEKFSEYPDLGNVPEEHYLWGVQTYKEIAIMPLEKAKEEIERKKAEISAIHESISAVVLLAKNADKPAAESEQKEEDKERGILSGMLEDELGGAVSCAVDFKEGLNYLSEKISALFAVNKEKEGKIKELQQIVEDLKQNIADLSVKYVPPPVNPKALVGQADAHRVLGKTYAMKNNAQGAVVQYKMAAGLYQRAADASLDEGHDEIKTKLSECKDALSRLEGVKHE